MQEAQTMRIYLTSLKRWDVDEFENITRVAAQQTDM
jgi:hypothetical protein